MGTKRADAQEHLAAPGEPPRPAPGASPAANDTAFDELLALVRTDSRAAAAYLERLRDQPVPEPGLQQLWQPTLPQGLPAEAPPQHPAHLLQLVMDAVPALVSYIDHTGIYRWVNRHYCHWFGMQRSQIVGRPYRDVVGDAIYRDLAPYLDRAMQGETVGWTRRTERAADPQPRWVNGVYTPDRDLDGTVRGVITTVRDVTTEREALNGLQESETHAQLLFETAPHALLVVDEHGCIERANRHAEALFACPLNRLLAQPVEQFIAGLEDIAPADGPGASADAGVFTGHRADGRPFLAQVSVGLLRSARHTSRIVGVSDISVQAEAQRLLTEHQNQLKRQVHERSAAVQQAESQLRLILESTADGLFGVDAEGRITFVNAAACSMLGRSAEALMGEVAHALLCARAEPPAAAASPLEHTLRTGEATRVEGALLPRPDAPPLPVVYEVRAMWRSGHIVGAVVSFNDITERVAAERARDAALAEAERLARVRTEFLTNMSHEIRTPLNAVLGLAEVAARGDRDRSPEETFRMILDSGQVLLGVVNDILDFAKIEAGKLRIESQPFELGPVIDRAVSLVAPRVFAKGLHFWVDESLALPSRLRGDALRLTQVLGNLLSNALKFTESGGIELRVWCDAHDLWFSVRDSGIGIAPESLQRLFKPFEQADSSTTRRFGGSGLGLVISRHLLDMMGGSISVRSEPGVGSTFSVRVPLVDAQPPAPPSPGRVALAGPVSQAHVAEALRHQGMEVHCTTARDGLQLAPDLVVLPADSLQDEALCDEAEAALQAGRRVAVVTHALAAELPASLRQRAILLEAPLRARHVATCLSRPTVPDLPREDTGGRLARMVVLAAEDNEVNGLVLEAIMRMEGARLTLVENGRLAVECVRQAGPGAYDLVLTDIQMPDMDGYVATREIHRLDPRLPVIGLTAHAMAEERDRCLAAGMVDHLAKPVELEQLVALALRHARPPSVRP
ncbi:PAS domain-containing protein [Ideonella sp. BN130291]|uniref:PAS domain-containing protein n=1 Tax=Ideonella sp. BN130291 TaxID=3112940 RepID=UPI002E262140|nr:PAS domain-containing protein [Ideonella sp. BN130291]